MSPTANIVFNPSLNELKLIVGSVLQILTGDIDNQKLAEITSQWFNQTDSLTRTQVLLAAWVSSAVYGKNTGLDKIAVAYDAIMQATSLVASGKLT